MNEKVLPIIVTTYEAFCACMGENLMAIYIYMEVLMEHTGEIYQSLEEHGYEIPGLPTRRGVLFVKGININDSVIINPWFL